MQRISQGLFCQGGGLDGAGYEEILASGRMVIGNPDTVVKQLGEGLANVRPGILGV